MSQHIPNVGCRDLLNRLTTSFGDLLMVHLFKADHVPTATDTVADYKEAGFAGYAPQTAVAWSDAATTLGITYSQADEQTYTKGIDGVGNDVYGYYVTDATGAVLLWAERDPNAPVDMNADGNKYLVTPRLRLASAS